MPSKQRRRIKRRTFAKLRIKRKKESSELIDTIDGNPIFTEDDFEDNRITKLLQQKQNANYDEDEQAIFLTDILDADSNEDDDDDDDINYNDNTINNNDNNDNSSHREMLEDIFSGQQIKEAMIMGSQLDHDPLDIATNASDLQYLLRHKKNKQNKKNKNEIISNDINLSQQLDEMDDEEIQNERVTMNEMIKNLNVPLAKSAAKQINEFDDNQEIQRLELTVQTKINNLHLARKERGLQMDRTRKEMQGWNQSISVKKEKLKHRRNMIPPRNNMLSFMENMEWNGDLGKELQCILDDYTKENDLNETLKKHKPTKQEVIKQSKKMADMRRQIANQIKDFKRIKKIKSKGFRKRLRARKLKITPSLQELQEIDPKLYQREIKKFVKQRAEERMTLKHKNSSIWAQRIIRRGKNGKMDINSRKALMEQLQRGQELKRKIKGIDSDDDIEGIEHEIDQKNKQNGSNSFETEIESENKRKEKMVQDAKDGGIWNMKFMKEAEDKRREDIKSLNKSAENAKHFGELDDIERQIENIEKSAYKINPMLDSMDDPIGAKKHEFWLKKQEKTKQIQINKAQSILGKRKFGFSDITNNIDIEPIQKKMKHRVLNIGDKAKVIDGTQQIEESIFGKGTKSTMRIDVGDNDKELITNNTLKQKLVNEPIFEMIQVPKHNDKKQSIGDINKNMQKNVNIKENGKSMYEKLRNNQKIKHQRYYVDDTSVSNDNNNKEIEDGWIVILDGGESVHSVHFGTLPPNTPKKVIVNNGILQEKEKLMNGHNENKQEEEEEEEEDLKAFMEDEEDDDDDDDEDDENENDDDLMDITSIKSILKRSKYDSVAKNNRHIKWRENEYSDGNPKTKYHSPNKIKSNIKSITKESNPWLIDLNKKPGNINNKKQQETTQFDPNKILIPNKLRKTPDFNLLETNDPKQIDMIYKSLNNKNNNNMAKYIENDTTVQEFNKLKESVISKSLPSAPELLKGWDNWTGFGINDDSSYKDDEYLEAKALWEKKKKKLIGNRNDGHLSNVILSDEISKKSSKYILKWQPEWVNIGMYRSKMDDTLGREWNLSTEFFNTIRPQYDIPSGYIIKPTQKQKQNGNGNGNNTNYKTSFGKKQKKQTTKLHSIYNNNKQKKLINNNTKHKYIDDRPQRDKI